MSEKNSAGKRGTMSTYRCDCGTEFIASVSRVKNGYTNSCGCKKGFQVGNKISFKHGYSKTPIEDKWGNMMKRCYDPNHKWFDKYGGNGVIVCKEWHDIRVFGKWCEDNGWKYDKVIDKDILCELKNISPKIYSPETCLLISNTSNANYGRYGHISDEVKILLGVND